MPNILKYSLDFYVSHIALILLFSLSFIIASLIPLFASFPTYNDSGAIFLRLASIFSNMSFFTAVVVVFSMLFSLLFLSFAIVAINVAVKHSRTGTKIRREVLEGLEKYTSSVFVVLLLYTIIAAGLGTLAYLSGIPAIVSSLIALAITPFFFYAPASIVIDEKGIKRAMQASFSFFTRKLEYFAIWVVVAIVLLTVFDFIFIGIGGTLYSRYLLLVFNSLFILPFLVVLQSQSYMRRFPLLKR